MQKMIEWEPADRVYIHVEVHLSWLDRLRVLLGRPLHVSATLDVEHAPGRTRTESRAEAAPIFAQRRLVLASKP